MSLKETLQRGMAFVADLGDFIPERERQRALQLRKDFAEQEQQLFERALQTRNRADAEALQQTAALAPEIDARGERLRNNELQRTIGLQNNVTANTGQILDTAGGVQANLIDTQGRNNVQQINAGFAGATDLRQTEIDGELAKLGQGRQAMQDQFGHERAMTGMFIGQTPLAEQSFGTALTMQQNQHDLIRELVERSRPTGWDRFAQIAGPLGIGLASLAS